MWIKSTYPSVLSVGLERALKTSGTSVHRGPQAPQGAEALSVGLYSATSQDDDSDIASEVQDLKIVAPDAAIVVFGATADLSLARAALQAGADGFLHAGMPPEQIARALHKAQSGHEVLPRELLRGVIKEMMDNKEMMDKEGRALSKLNARKVEILEMVTEGLSNAQIAKRLYLSESTIKQHLRTAYKALGVKTRNQAAALMLRSSNSNGAARRRSLRSV
jgi:DNA-binding NarL/FixJ family response regulator